MIDHSLPHRRLDTLICHRHRLISRQTAQEARIVATTVIITVIELASK